MEEWKDVTGYEGIYSISSLGRVYSHHTDKVRKTKINNSGYEMVSLFKDGKEKTNLVHRMVAREFCEGYKEELDVNHIDANRLNNVSGNLEWLTRKQNIRDSMRRGTHSVKEAHAVAHLKRRRKVTQKTLSGDIVNSYESVRAAAKALGEGYGENYLSACARGVTPTAYGFMWEYEDEK